MAHVQAPEAGWDYLSLAAALERFASGALCICLRNRSSPLRFPRVASAADRSMCNGTRQAWGRDALDFAQLLMQPNPPRITSQAEPVGSRGVASGTAPIW